MAEQLRLEQGKTVARQWTCMTCQVQLPRQITSGRPSLQSHFMQRSSPFSTNMGLQTLIAEKAHVKVLGVNSPSWHPKSSVSGL